MQNGISVPFFNPEGLTALLDGSPVFFLGVFLMQTYIITMDMENELSEAAASALNGRFFTCPQNYQAIWDQVSDYLSDKGFPHGIAQDVFEAVEYFTQNFHSENWPSKDLNLFAAAVSVEHAVEDQGCADLLHLLRNKDDVEASFEDYVQDLTGKDLQWVYGRNRDAVNHWLAESRTDLFDLLESQENLAEVVTVLWAKALLGKYFDKYGRNIPSSSQLEADEAVSA
ncbi:Uncharacterised protein [Neisseria meningitidis]|nr:Uncharacterised protein [Neisseria meningitidis]CWT46911.1 Uncharacterised protein [Neisseria meningitidis]